MNINATIFGQIIAFVLFVIFCMRFVWPPLIAVIEKRQQEIIENFNSIAEAKKNLDLEKSEILNQLKEAKIKASMIIDQANNYRSKILDKAKIEIEQERNKLINQAKLEINIERKRIYEDLRKQVAMISVSVAEKIINHCLNEDIDNKIISRFIDELIK